MVGCIKGCAFVSAALLLYIRIHLSFLYEKIKITPVFMAPLLSLWC